LNVCVCEGVGGFFTLWVGGYVCGCGV